LSRKRTRQGFRDWLGVKHTRTTAKKTLPQVLEFLPVELGRRVPRNPGTGRINEAEAMTQWDPPVLQDLIDKTKRFHRVRGRSDHPNSSSSIHPGRVVTHFDSVSGNHTWNWINSSTMTNQKRIYRHVQETTFSALILPFNISNRVSSRILQGVSWDHTNRFHSSDRALTGRSACSGLRAPHGGNEASSHPG
jgi:hypothetical protein